MLFIFLSPPSNESPRQNCDCWKVSGKFLVSQQDERSFKNLSLLAALVDCHPCVSSHYERWEIQFVDGAQVRGSFWRSIYQALPCWLRFSGAQDKKNSKVNFLPLIICHLYFFHQNIDFTLPSTSWFLVWFYSISNHNFSLMFALQRANSKGFVLLLPRSQKTVSPCMITTISNFLVSPSQQSSYSGLGSEAVI